MEIELGFILMAIGLITLAIIEKFWIRNTCLSYFGRSKSKLIRDGLKKINWKKARPKHWVFEIVTFTLYGLSITQVLPIWVGFVVLIICLCIDLMVVICRVVTEISEEKLKETNIVTA